MTCAMQLPNIAAPETSLITIVDDEACIRESLSSLIRSEGYRAKVYSSAEEFLTWGWWDDSACLIVDVRLPVMNGLQLQSYLEETRRDRPIVFISGHASDNEQTWGLMKGAVAFLRKPFSDEALLKAVRHSLVWGMSHRGTPHAGVATQVCPMCRETAPLAYLPEHLINQESDVRTATLDMIKILRPDWSEESGLCKRCWRFYVGLGSIVDYLRTPPNAGGEEDISPPR